MNASTVFVRVITAAAAVAASAMVSGDRSDPTPIDQALPFVAVMLVIASLLTQRFAGLVMAAVPVLIFAAIAIPQERPRLLAYGAVVSAGLIIALFGMVERRTIRIEFWRAMGLILIIIALLKAIPLTSGMLLPLVTLLAGLTFLTYVASGSFTSLHVIPIVVAAGLVTPLSPFRASLFPLLLAMVLSLVRTGSLRWLGAGAIVALVAGKWAMLLVALSAAAPLWIRWRQLGNSAVALPPQHPAWPALARALIFSPATVLDAFLASRGTLISAALLAVVAVFLRPALTLLYLIAAISVLLPIHPSATRQRQALPSGIFAAMWVILFAWSGILAPAFPVPWNAAPEELRTQPVGHALAAGQSSVILPGVRTPTLFVVVFGSNVSHLRPGTSVGRIDFAGASGRGFVRELTMTDLADWGAFRSGHFFATRNRVPRDARILLSGYGAEAFAASFARIELRLNEPIESIRVSAAPSLPAAARLELRQLEFPH